VLVNGTVAGVWEQDWTKRQIEVTVQPFRQLSAAQRRQIQEGADRLGRFLGAPAAVSYTSSG
jgi:winged helix DNA-binding protein